MVDFNLFTNSMKQPLFLPVIAVICGILAGNGINSPLYLLALIPIIFVFLKWFRQHLLTLCLFLISWGNQDLYYYPNSNSDLRMIFKDNAAIVSVRGKIDGLISEKHIKSSSNKIITKFNLKCSEIFLDSANQWIKVNGKVFVIVNNSLSENYFDGQLIEAKGVIKPPSNEKIFGLFSFQKILWNKYIYYIFQIDSTNELKDISYRDNKPSLPYRFGRWASQILQQGMPDERKNSDIRQAMLFGWKGLLEEDVNDNFIRSGTMHLFAVSGSHISLLSGAIIVLLRAFCIPRIFCGIIVIPAMWFFTSVTGMQASAIRATVMLTVIVGGWMFSRPSNLLNSLFAAAILILLWQPSQLFQAGFQLSFMVVLSIALLPPLFKNIFERLIQNDPYLPKQLQPFSFKIINPVLGYTGGAIVTSLGAFVGSFPLIAYYFNMATVVSIIANLVVIPLSALCLISSLGSIATGFWWQDVAELFNWSGWFWSKSMVYFTKLFSSFNYGWFYVPKPSISFILFCYLFLISIATKIFYKPKIRIYFVAIVLIWASSLLYSFASYTNNVELNIISFKKGHSVYIDKRFSKNYLIDCGSDYDIRATIEPLVVSRGANKISNLFLTHGDAAHIRGATNLSKLYKLNNVYTTDVKYRSKYYQDTLNYFSNNFYKVTMLKSGNRIDEIEVLYPILGMENTAADDTALVLRANYFGQKILFLSDLSVKGIEYLKYISSDLSAEIVVISKYLLSSRLDNELLDLIKPKLIVIAEEGEKHDIPPALLSELKRRNILIEQVEPGFGLTILLNKQGWQIEKPQEIQMDYPQFDEL